MRLLIASVAAFILTLGTAALRAADQLPQKFTNLQVFPKDVAGQDLIAAMKQFCLQNLYVLLEAGGRTLSRPMGKAVLF
jgi:hypothetical protein